MYRQATLGAEGLCVSENYDKPFINLFRYRSKANVYLQISVTLRRGFILFYTGMYVLSDVK